MNIFYSIYILVPLISAHPQDTKSHWRPSGYVDITKFRNPRLTVSKPDEKGPAEEEVWKPAASYQGVVKDFSAECGIENFSGEGKIVGGHETRPNQWPWQVALVINDNTLCGGSIIGDEWVLTAAHCAEHGGEFRVIAGAHHWMEASEAHRQEIYSHEYLLHPQWGTNGLSYDVALIHLPEPVTFNDFIRPACLPGATDSADPGEMATVTGWGDDGHSNMPEALKMVEVEVIPNGECFHESDPKIICTSTWSGTEYVGTCFGDSGGPLVQKEGTKSAGGQKWIQQGIVSFGTNIYCGYGANGYTRITHFTDWIHSVTGIKIH